MARQCKCKACGAVGTTDTFFLVKVNNRNQYYCSEEEYNEINKENKDKERMYEVFADILGYDYLTPNFRKKLAEIPESPAIIVDTFNRKRSDIIYAINNKTFQNDFLKFSYILAIVKNNVQETKALAKKKEKQIRQTNDIDLELFNMENTKRKPHKGISEFLEGDEV